MTSPSGLLTADELLQLHIPDTAGTRLVWVVDSDRRAARAYRRDGTEAIVAGDQGLEGEDVLPGFSCRLDTIL